MSPRPVPVAIFHTCDGNQGGHVGTFVPLSSTRLGCGCTRFRLRRCDGTELHALTGCALHPTDLEQESRP